MSYIMDFFAANTLEKVNAAIAAKIVQYPAYVFIRSQDGSDTGRLAFVDQNNVLKFIVGEECKTQVVRVDELPPVEEGDSSVLYICEDVVYTFNGEEYVPSYKDHSAEIEALTERIAALETSSAEVTEKVANLETGVDALDEQLTALEEKVNAIEIPEECKCGADFVFTDVPEGTLVDYHQDEIRVMCPANTVFTKQAVGVGGDADSYYGTLRTYVPDEAVTGYIEHLGDQSDAEILTTFSTDEKGRRYQPTWLALAKYDSASDSWTYYGASSTKERYIGWNYRIDWYNADGVMIGSDSIRINLSNEECHFVNEPYYMGKYNSMAEEIEALQAKVDDLEANSTKFIELE